MPAAGCRPRLPATRARPIAAGPPLGRAVARPGWWRPDVRAPCAGRSSAVTRGGGRGQRFEGSPSGRLPREPGRELERARSQAAPEGLVAQDEVEVVGQLGPLGQEAAGAVVDRIQVTRDTG